jgi:RNA polymerase sigma-70 factor (ECF subfamily)
MNDARRLRDEWLALRCQREDDDAFAALVAELEAPLLYYAAKLTQDYETAKDVVQDAWVRAARDIQRLERPSAIRSWLYRLVHGLAVDRVRRDVAREHAEDASWDGSADPDDLIVTADRAQAVHEALDQLPPKHREVLVLRFLEQFSLEEIAHVVRCSEGTVKSRLHYAKAALRSFLENTL